MRYLLLFLLCPLSLSAQTPVSTFPTDWLGDWHGDMTIYNGSGKVQEIQMELHLASTDSAGRWQWTLVYATDSVLDERKYELVAIDAEKGHYAVDEKNSIVLDSYLFNNVLSSRFSVGTSLLIVNYTFLDDRVEFQILYGPNDQGVQTGEDVENIGEILAFPMNGMQRATLYRK